MNSPKRPRTTVCMVVAGIPPVHSGIGAQAMLLARELRIRGERVVLLTPRERGSKDQDDFVRRVGWGYPRGAVAVAAFAIEAALWLVAHRRTVSIVHLHGGGAGPVSIGVVAHLLRLPVVYKVSRLGDDDPVSAARRRGGRVRSWTIRRAKRVIAISPAIRAVCIDAGIHPNRIADVPNGVDLERFKPVGCAVRRAERQALGVPADSVMALFVGALETRKRTSELVELWEAVADPQDTLWLVGPIADQPDASTTRVRMPGQVSDTSPYLRAADVFVFLSSAEGLPNALLEAQAAGVPAIVSALPGVHDYIVTTGESGIILRDISHASFSAAWQMARDPRARAALGAGARVNARRFDIRSIAGSYRDIYRECLGD